MFDRMDLLKGNKEVEQQLFNQLLQAVTPLMQVTGINPLPFLKGVIEASPVAKQLDLKNMFPETGVTPQEQDLLNNENPALESALLKTAQSAGATQPGGGAPAGSPAVGQGFPNLTTAGIQARPGGAGGGF